MIRPAHRYELPALTDLAMRSKAHWGYSDTFMRLCHHELTVTEDLLPHVYVKEIHRRLLGFHALCPLDESRVELEFLFVEPERIGAGLGRELLTHAQKVARDHGWQVLLIQGDPNASNFYTHCGALKVGERASASIPDRTLPLYELPTRQATQAAQPPPAQHVGASRPL